MPVAIASQAHDAALKRRLALASSTGPMAAFQNLRVVGICLFACIGGLLYGYNQGVFSGVLTMTSFGNHMGDYIQNSTKKGWLTSILELGAWFGTLYSGFVAESFSRKYAILFSTGIFILGVVIQCTGVTSAGANSILAGRFIVGMGVGALSMIVPMLIIDNAECAPPEIRGLLISLQQLSIEFGILISFWIDYGTNYIGGTGETQSDAAWLVPLCLQLVPAVILFVGMIFMPFSPRWLVHHDREEEARRVIRTLRGNVPNADEVVELEFLEIKAQSLFEKRSTAEKFPHLAEPTVWNNLKLQFVAIGSLFTSMPMFKRVIVSTVTMFFQQWTGINAVLYYAPTIFNDLGLSGNTTSLLATGVVGIVMFLTTIPVMFYIDRFGRKPILISGALAMGFNHLVIAVIFARDSNNWPDYRAAGWAAIVMVWLFAGNFGWSWGPCAWIVVAEVWPLSARPYGIALGASSNWMNNFIVGQVTPDMITHLKYGTFIFFGVMIILGAGFVYFFVPETKQLTLEEMDVIFGSQGFAAADQERLDQIYRELGLTDRISDTEAVEVKEHDIKAE
ncbi:putative MFS sugar transporter [Talaromyces proteolyticus]|uniref:MFS sugar transporter n=1 Tax=Talaromyces proteolyticus TaxID=1131652 RepID=A0AAD4KQG1_9EURO|nr:putative MFS sugar transporter [Talaromyces proteolyticus]KAH8696062.1 putative MFS sugar transporter [Talaromyces proteolyticus]